MSAILVAVNGPQAAEWLERFPILRLMINERLG